MTIITTQQIARVQSDWSRIAKEEIRIDVIGGTFYGFGSELAVLRIAYEYRETKASRVSSNKVTGNMAFVLETKL